MEVSRARRAPWRLAALLVIAALAVGALADAVWAREARRVGAIASVAAPSTTSTTSTTGPSTTTTTTVASAPYDVEQSEVELVDPSRDEPGRIGGGEGRSMRVVVVRPEGVEQPAAVVFAHGFDSEPEVYLPLLQDWARAGELVVAPELPDSARDLPGEPDRDIASEADDLAFVVDRVVAGELGTVTTVAVAGHSDGGSAVATLALDTAHRDGSIAGYAVLSGVIAPEVTDGPWDSGTGAPLLVVVGTADEYGNLPASTEVYDRDDGPKQLVTVPDGDHLGIYVEDGSQADGVRATTTAFLLSLASRPAPSRAS